jgi:hypothetical protein
MILVYYMHIWIETLYLVQLICINKNLETNRAVGLKACLKIGPEGNT